MTDEEKELRESHQLGTSIHYLRQAGLLNVLNNNISSAKEMSDTIGKIAFALSKAQASLENATKDKKGFTEKHRYATLSSCLDALKQPFFENNLAFTQLVSLYEGEMVLITLLIHESGEWLKSIFPLKHEVARGMNDMQAIGSAISYGRRYSLCAATGLGQEDDDAATSKTNYSAPKVSYEKPKVIVESPTEALIKLCTNAMINLKDFTNFHNISSTKPETVKHAIDNFASLRHQWDNRELELEEDLR